MGRIFCPSSSHRFPSYPPSLFPTSTSLNCSELKKHYSSCCCKRRNEHHRTRRKETEMKKREKERDKTLLKETKKIKEVAVDADKEWVWKKKERLLQDEDCK